jgi:hypothetical protein
VFTFARLKAFWRFGVLAVAGKRPRPRKFPQGPRQRCVELRDSLAEVWRPLPKVDLVLSGGSIVQTDGLAEPQMLLRIPEPIGWNSPLLDPKMSQVRLFLLATIISKDESSFAQIS